MQIKSRGLVLSTTKFKETSVIVKIFTEELGLQSFLINGVRAKKSKIGIALFQPLTILDTVFYHSERKSLHRVSEVKCHYHYNSIPYDVRKSTITIFLAEWLNKTIKAYEQDKNLYEFLEGKMITLDKAQEAIENYHINFIIELTRFLGVLPESVHDFPEDTFFQAEAGIKEKLLLEGLIKGEQPTNINRDSRKKLILLLAAYYRYHLGSFGAIKSLPVLHDVLS